MKKILNFIMQIVLSAALSAGVSIIALAILGIRDMGVFLWTYLLVAIAIALLMGAFDMDDERKSEKHTSIKDATRNYGQAAVFIGTACLYMGTPQQCEDVCDDLWHRGVQAEYHELTGEETQFDII